MLRSYDPEVTESHREYEKGAGTSACVFLEDGSGSHIGWVEGGR